MDEQQFFKERTESNLLVQVLQRYLPFWPLFLITISIGLAVSWFYLRQQTRIYVASARVLLKDPQKGGDSKVLDALNIFTEKKIVENELIVLRSSSLIERVAASLDLYASVYNQGKIRVEELYKTNSPIWFKAINKDSVTDGGKHYFSVDWIKNRIKINGQFVPFESTVVFENTTYRIVPNPDYNRHLPGKNYYVVFNSLE